MDTQTNVQPLWFDSRQLETVLGLKRSYIQWLLRNGRLPAVRCGKYWKVPRKALETWVEEQLDLTQGKLKGLQSVATDIQSTTSKGDRSAVPDKAVTGRRPR